MYLIPRGDIKIGLYLMKKKINSRNIRNFSLFCVCDVI